MNNVFLCDVDGVLADTHTAWLERYNFWSKDNLTPNKITDWEISKFVLPDWKERIWEIFEDPKLYDSVLPIEGALKGVIALREHGWRIVFVTSPSNNENPMRRYIWLKENGFCDTMNDFIVARDKTIIQGNCLLDDNPNTISKYTHGAAILFSQPWNQSMSWWAVARNWDDVLKKVNC